VRSGHPERVLTDKGACFLLFGDDAPSGCVNYMGGVFMDSGPLLERLKKEVRNVTPEEANRAAKNLSVLWQRSIDLANIDPDKILSERVGPTKDCLSVEQLADVTELSAVKSGRLLHWSKCPDCSKAVAIYQSVKARLDESKPPYLLYLRLVEPIRLQMPTFTLQGDLHMTEAIGSVQVKPSELFHSGACRLEQRQTDPAVGDSPGESVYRISCEIRPTAICRSLPTNQRIVDWVELRGLTRTGIGFTARKLAQFENGAFEARSVGAGA
jgi:hypothetical protein